MRQPVGVGDVEANQLSCRVLIAERNDVWVDAYAQQAPLADVGDRWNCRALRGTARGQICALFHRNREPRIQFQRGIGTGRFREKLWAQSHAAKSHAGVQNRSGAESGRDANRMDPHPLEID